MTEVPDKPTPVEPAPASGSRVTALLVRWLIRGVVSVVLLAVLILGVGGCVLAPVLFRHRLSFSWEQGFQFEGLEADMAGRQGLPASTDKPTDTAVQTNLVKADLADAKAAFWPGWRGPTGQGLIAAGEHAGELPTTWSSSDGIVWRTPIPGIGHSSPVIWGDRVYLTASFDNGAKRELIALDRRAGQILWRTPVSDANPGPMHSKHAHASSTPTTNGKVVVCFFGNAGLFGFDASSGKQMWQVPLGSFTGIWGTASSPIIAGDRVFHCVDDDSACFIAAYSLADGKQIWRTPRDQDRSFSSPLMVELGDGKRELIINGKGRVWAYDPDDGKALWLANGQTEWVTPTVVAGHGLVFASSGRVGPTLAIKPGGRGDVTASHIAWRVDKGSPYIPSTILVGEVLYMINDNGVLTAYRAKTGELIYRQRVGGEFTASPVAGDGKLYLSSEAGDVTVLAVGDSFNKLATNSFGERILASPAAAEGRLYIRTDEALYCVGRPFAAPPKVADKSASKPSERAQPKSAPAS